MWKVANMAELVTVYTTLEPDACRVVQYLRSRNLNPVVLDDLGKMGTYRNHAHEVRIAVSQTERDMALSVLAEMERDSETRLAPHVKVASGAVMLLMTILGFVAIVALLDRSGKWFAAVWLVLTTAVAVALIRWAWRKKA